MDKRRLLLLSNSTNYGEEYLAFAKPSLQTFLGKGVDQVLFIPYAGVTFSYDAYTSKVAAAFSEIGYDVRGIHTFSDPVEAVKNAGAVAVGGGNTFELLNQLYNQGIMSTIRARIKSGMHYMGWSAGSNVAGPSIRTTNDMPIVEPESFDALKLVPFQINPHYTEARLPNHGGETREDRLNEFLVLNQKSKVVGIPEGNILQVSDDRMNLIGPDRVKVFEYGSEPVTYDSEKDLSFLLD